MLKTKQVIGILSWVGRNTEAVTGVMALMALYQRIGWKAENIKNKSKRAE